MFATIPAVEIGLPALPPHYFGATQLQDHDKFLSGPEMNVNNISKLITYITVNTVSIARNKRLG